MKISKDLASVHQDIFNKLKIEEGIEQDEKDAKTLTSFLMTVKRFIYTDEKFYATEDGYKNAEVLQKYLQNETAKQFAQELLQPLDNKGKKLFASLLFAPEKQDHTFEQAFSIIQKLAYQAATGKEVEEEIFRAGQEYAGIGSSFNKSGSTYIDLTKIPNDIAKLSLEQLQKYFGKNFSSKEQVFMYFNQVYQKIDAKSLTLDIKYKAGLSSYATHVYKLLLTKNFSLKNYYSAGLHGLDTERLEIGNTTFFRSIISALQYSGLSYEDAIKYFYRGISAIEYHGDTSTIQHFNHLKHIYEYTGAGQKVYLGDGEWGDLKTVDFIVYNDPSSTFIQVISVKKVLKEAIETLKDSDRLIQNVTYVANRGVHENYWKNSK